MRKLLLTFAVIGLGLTSCEKETITETIVETETIEVEIQPEIIDSPYAFDLTEFENIANVIQIKEIAGSEGFRTWNYKELGELDALIEQGYIVLKNNSCCLEEAKLTMHVIEWDGTRHTFDYIIRK